MVLKIRRCKRGLPRNPQDIYWGQVLKFTQILREQHRNMYIIKGETDHQPRLDAWDKCSGLVHWEDPEGWGGEGGGKRDRDGEHM